MENFEIKIIPTHKIESILPLLEELNPKIEKNLLKTRLLDMVSQQYKCVGVFHYDELIGISGLWFLTRLYCGKVLEPDHVIITKKYRSQGLGKILFKWIYDYAQSIGFEASELNTYIANVKSHDFYENEGFQKLGYHYIKYF